MGKVTFADIRLKDITLDDMPRLKLLRDACVKAKPEICIERTRYVTGYLRDMSSEEEPMETRYAKAVNYFLSNKEPLFFDDNLLAGTTTSKYFGAPVYPEFTGLPIWPELDTISTREKNPQKLSESEKDELNFNIFPYWMERNILEYARKKYHNPQCMRLFERIIFFIAGKAGCISHTVPCYKIILEKGLDGIIADASAHETRIKNAGTLNAETAQQRVFYEAVRIAMEGIKRYARNLSEKAAALAKEETDAFRRDNYLKMSEVCARVPAYPARTFREAVNSLWLAQVAVHAENINMAMSPGRLDQVLYPYYNNDINNGTLSVKDAAELIGCLWLKLNDNTNLVPETAEELWGGSGTVPAVTVGGVDEYGDDAVNDLTYLMLRITELLRTRDPNMNARYHYEKNSRKYRDRIAEVIVTTKAVPAFHNDVADIKTLENQGTKPEHARDYAIIGCVEPGWHGRASCASNAAYFNLLKCLELALGNGVCAVTGRAVGPKTGDPAGFASIGDVMGAFERQVAWWVRRTVAVFNVIERVHQSYVPFPFNSALVADCLERGKDYLAGGARYNLNGMQGVGIANVADALAGIEQVVFRERRLTLARLIEALRNDFGSDADLHEHLRLRVPHYGNDDEKVDRFAREAGQIYCREVERYTSPRGARYHPGLYPVSANIPLGRDVGASADGRLARSPLADGVAPRHGADTLGPTAVLRSAARLDQALASNGTQLNQKFLPAVFRSPRDRAKFASYLRAFVGLPIQEVQFNVVDRRTLQDAQAHPERHPNLVVRVAGYSAFFNDLDRSTQDDIVGRTEQTL